jgi:lycopene cyclase domain-containing protein
MFGSFTYVVWLFQFLGVPLLAVALAFPRALWRQRRALGLTVAGSLLGGWAWDALAVRLGAWSFDPGHTLGWWLAGLPLEEWLWIVGTTLLFAGLTIALAETRLPWNTSHT